MQRIHFWVVPSTKSWQDLCWTRRSFWVSEPICERCDELDFLCVCPRAVIAVELLHWGCLSFFHRSSVLFEVLSRANCSSEGLTMAVHWMQNLQLLSRSGQKCSECFWNQTFTASAWLIFGYLVRFRTNQYCIHLWLGTEHSLSDASGNSELGLEQSSDVMLTRTVSLFHRITCCFVTHVTEAFTWSAVTHLSPGCRKVRTLCNKLGN